MSILETIERPADIKSLGISQLTILSREIREEILHTISQLGGHLASSLGAVELCLAMHYVFDAPDDQLIWDMGYQAFAHKLITGRRKAFKTLKQFKGLSGFNNPAESPYDYFLTGHGGTSLSTALGLAMARDQVAGSSHVVSIIGDASLGEGMALEALNHIGHLEVNILIVLNDNRMSIAEPVGGLSRYLNRIITNPIYNRVRRDVEKIVKRLPAGRRVVKLGRKVEESLKGLLVPGLVFEELGFRYIGPIDGHNLRDLIRTLKNIKRLNGPTFLHIVTRKGKGYRFAEQDPERFHKIEPFDLTTGKLRPQGSRLKSIGQPRALRLSGPSAASAEGGAPLSTFSEAFSDELVQLASRNPRIVAITAAMPEGTGLNRLAAQFPEQYIDVGMAEQHAIGLAAGLARGGARPVFAVYSTFLQRAYDQIMHEMCLQRLPIILALDRAGLVGEDGPTHHGVFDICYLRSLPEVVVMAPKDPQELRAMLRWSLTKDLPIAIRYPRGGIVCGESLGKPSKVQLGCAETLRNGKDLALLALGSMVYPALEVSEALAKQGIEATVVNARFVKPIDQAMVGFVIERTRRIVTLEEGQVSGGFGSAVSEALEALGDSRILQLRVGIPDRFIEHGTRCQLLKLCELDVKGLIKRISAWYRVEDMHAGELSFLSER